MKQIINKFISYKNRNFNSWIEFIMTFGICSLNDGGYLLFTYGWGGIFGLLSMFLMLKYCN